LITDALRPPPLLDPTAGAYKDWLHVNVFDAASGMIGIFNASLHGSPTTDRARAIGTALVHLPEVGWTGNIETLDLRDAGIGTTSIALETIAVATDPEGGTVLVSARRPGDGLEAGVTARATSRAVDIEQPLPFGAGWISWFVVPRLAVTGGVVAADRRIDLSNAIAYHDHNWGRWHWGDDVGWEWGAFASAEPAVTLVVSRATNRAHTRSGGTTLIAEVAGERRVFSGGAIAIDRSGSLNGDLRRLPGALAALHQDRRAPRLPAEIVVRATDGVDRVDIAFRPRAAAQLIAGDPVRRGYGFLHQLVGEFDAECRSAGRLVRASGLAVFEHVD
jgi:hypothetical protein